MIHRYSHYFSARLAHNRWAALILIGFVLAALLGHGTVRSAESFSGYPVPRFESLGATQVNVRAGPSKLHPIKWQYVRHGLPVEVMAETEEWRHIRDAHGFEGWVFHTLLDRQRTVLVTGDGTKRPIALREQPDRAAPIVAVAEPGALIRLEECKQAWCMLASAEARGWVHRSLIWGAAAIGGAN